MSSAIVRQWLILSLLPKAPRRIDAAALEERLKERGTPVHRRTIQRDLLELSAIFPLVSDERTKPYGWRWSEDAEFMCTLPAMPEVRAERDFEVTLEIRKLAVRAVLERLRARDVVEIAREPRSIRLRAMVADDCASRRALLAHADEVEVLAPSSLRAEIAVRAKRASEIHAS